MTRQVIFIIIVAGMFVGGLLSKWLTRNDLFARFACCCAGAAPGVSLLVGEPWFMLFIPVFLVPLLFRRKTTG